MSRSDPKPQGRIRDAQLLSHLHDLYRGTPCWSCGKRAGQNLHHRHSRDDTVENLAWLCGTGSSGCHGAIHGNPYIDADGFRVDAVHVREALLRRTS